MQRADADWIPNARELLTEAAERLDRSDDARQAYAWLAVTLLISAPPDVELPARAWFDGGHRTLVDAGDLPLAAGLGCTAAERLLQDGRPEDALRVAELALQTCPDDPAETHARLRLARADAWRLTGAWARALEQLDALAVDLPRDGDPALDVVRARTHGSRCQVLLEVGLLAEAAEALEAEQSVVDELANPHLTFAHALHRMDERLRHDDGLGLLALLEDSAKLLRPGELGGSYPWEALYCALALASIARDHQGRSAEARGALEDALRDERLGTSHAVLLSRALADLLLDVGEVERAAAEVARARVLLGEDDGRTYEADARFVACEARVALASGAPRAELERLEGELERGLDRMLAAWREVPRPPGGLDFLGIAERRGVAVERMRLLLRLDPEHGAERALEVLLAVQSHGSVALSASFGGTDLAEVRELLLAGPGHGALAVVPGARHALLFALDEGRPAAFELADYRDLRSALRATARRLVHHLSSAGRDADGAQRRAREVDVGLRALGEWLLPPALRERVKGWTAMTIIGGDALEGVPPEALPWKDGRLGDRMAVDHLPTFPLGVMLARRGATTSGSADPPDADLLVIASLEPGEDVRERFDGLWTRELEPDDLAPLVDGWPAERVRLEIGATPSRVRSLEMRSIPVTHVLCHGVYDPTRVRGATLVLSADPDGTSLLRCEDLEALELSDLVVLSACGAALGPRRVGEDDLAHLGGAILAGGAETVVLGRAPLELDGSLQLFGRFYDELRRGRTAAAALQRARASVGDDPWARFEAAHVQVVGLGRRSLSLGR